MDKLIAMAKTFGQELTTADEELKQVKGELKELQDIMLNNMTELTSKNELHKECEKLTEENKKLKEALAVSEKPSLKQSLSEAMKENGSWMTHMKQDYEVQLRTQKDMVSMYCKENKKLKEEIASNPWTKLDLPNGKHTWQRISN